MTNQPPRTPTDPACPDCGAEVNEPHDDGCDVARCLATGGQRLQCDGYDYQPFAEHDCGNERWSGRWPGVAECVEFGWWVQGRCTEGLGFVPCAPDAPGAMPDLNRLGVDAVWDRDRRRWVLRQEAQR